MRADESIGTPMTGRVVCAATTPARCAAAPAPTTKTFTPRLCASRINRSTRAGERCADATVISHFKPNSFSTSPAALMIAASESLPIRISTSIGVIVVPQEPADLTVRGYESAVNCR